MSLDRDSVRDSWNRAADPYADGQASGRDFYRYEFFGPAQIALCGDVRGLRALDVGCGAGYFARELAVRGANVSAADLSPRMVEKAREIEAREPLGVSYTICDAADLLEAFGPGTFDLVTSCVALQDMPDIPGALAAVRGVLRPGGRFVASFTHPCSDTPFRRWEKDEAGDKRWLCVDRYFERGPIEYTWVGWSDAPFTTAAMHLTLEDWFAWFLAAGFTIRGVHEPRPTPEAIARRPELEDASRIPYFLFMDVVA